MKTNNPAPSTDSYRLTEGKLARNLQVPVKVKNLTGHQWEMFIAIRSPKLKDTENSAVIHGACTELWRDRI